MRHYFNLDGSRVVPNVGCDDTGVFSDASTMGGARIFSEARVPDTGCDDPTPDPSNPVGSANCYLGYYCPNPQAYNYNVLYDVTPEEERIPNVTPNSCSNSDLCDFIFQEEDGGVGVVTGANPLYGCTDPNALNYDINAEYNDGTCEYPSEPAEDPFPQDDDELVNIFGCTDPSALNYSPDANVPYEVGLPYCEYEEEVGSLNTTTLFVAGGAAILLLLALRKR